ncbi:MAG: hypothetical protein M1416_00325 [Candidatus Pacearchaeota archaeon]|nr:hypothetical protein [Candidatus Pacearchaeota archaeon]
MLTLILEYDINKDKFDIKGNVKEDCRKDFVSNFLYLQMGKGIDENKAEKRDMYNIKIDLDLTEDKYTVSDNCGNKGLRDGILMRYAGLC